MLLFVRRAVRSGRLFEKLGKIDGDFVFRLALTEPDIDVFAPAVDFPHVGYLTRLFGSVTLVDANSIGPYPHRLSLVSQTHQSGIEALRHGSRGSTDDDLATFGRVPPAVGESVILRLLVEADVLNLATDVGWIRICRF